MSNTPEIIHETATASAHEVGHTGPHILAPKGDIIEGWDIFGLHITTTVFSTWIFMVVLFILVAVFYTAIRTAHLPRIKAWGLDVVNRILAYATGLL